jgi:hypothetical protein
VMTTQKSRNPTLLIQHSIKPLVVMDSLDADLKLRTYPNVAFFLQPLLPVQAGYTALIFGTVLFCLPRGNRLVSEIGRVEGKFSATKEALLLTPPALRRWHRAQAAGPGGSPATFGLARCGWSAM